jgi:cysteine synthase
MDKLDNLAVAGAELGIQLMLTLQAGMSPNRAANLLLTGNGIIPAEAMRKILDYAVKQHTETERQNEV